MSVCSISFGKHHVYVASVCLLAMSSVLYKYRMISLYYLVCSNADS